ncbi:MAG: hydrogenase expression/formation protein HypE [Methanosarcina flavescens]|jgi:hydrogenase expression/formation protein HypE|uniref:Hydrogenase expression/formation protein HypE n=1 Tax=Methanosarcina flavescens TaxID=1715806 RepID=A0A660HU11_9EURY|nr:hydrogenase expression/formation protein HypE [Methanosarcina flavescens]AYK15609.1 hydrogenase expression/formation protein HypE [Methanosarcina flavescens]NLK33628.1 hydrogenase expression/formation protein HypE [Methanosarcina flavescens]
MKSNTISLEHGAGGEVMQALIGEIILKNFHNKSAGSIGLECLDDGSTVRLEGLDTGCELVLTTDSHVITPAFFPNTNIGRLAVAGTINDLTVMGAKPLALTCAVVVPEGFPLTEFEEIIKTMDETAAEAGVPIITGDTKTVEKAALDSIILNTAGLGITDSPVRDSGLQVGDKILVTGTIGDHGISLMAHREGFDFDTDLVSDSAPLWKLIEPLLKLKTLDGKPVITAMKDPTRGGLANALNEMAEKSGTGILIEEDWIPFKPAVSAACEMLGLDPLEVANEGKAVIGVRSGFEEEVLSILRQHPYGRDAAVIGEVTPDNKGEVILRNRFGGMRYVDIPAGDPIPRVC